MGSCCKIICICSVSIAVLAAGLAGCDGGPVSGGDAESGGDAGPSGDPCAGVTCSGRGTCVAGGASAGCDCDDGYHAAGLQCLIDNAIGDPVTTAMTGSGTIYNVGPDQDYEEPDTVPWGALAGGDVINIFHRDAPYTWKLCLRAQGTAEDPIVINGVTDDSGNRPRLEFNGSQTASGCNPGGDDDIFNTASEWSLEDYAGIIIRAGVSDPWAFKPAWIEIRNLELHGPTPDAAFTNLLGEDTNFIGSPAAIWIQPSTDILIENCVIYDSGFGVFTMAKNSSLDEACERITLRSNRIYGNGVIGSYYEHNVYMQSTNPVVEGNYLGVLRDGATGSTYKSRSSGEIFRYNYVEASARAIDLVFSEEQTAGIATQPDYGVDYVDGNIFVNDCALAHCASSPIHYGGDNLGEQDDVDELFVPTTPYRSHLFFYSRPDLGNGPCSVPALDLGEHNRGREGRRAPRRVICAKPKTVARGSLQRRCA